MARLGDICTKASSSIKQSDLDAHNGDYPIYGASGLIKHVDFYEQDDPYIAVVKDGAGIGRVMQLPAKSSVIGTMQYIIPNSGIDVSYLAYAMEFMNLSKYYTGATIPHIYFKDYCLEPIPEHSQEEQQRIAAVLDKVSDLIALRKQQLAKLDELVKARFVEMFGDPVSNPMGWVIQSWSEVFQTTTGKLDSNAAVVNGEYPFFTCAKEWLWIDKYAFDCEALLLSGNNAAGVYDVKYYCGKFNAYQRTYVLRLNKKEWSYQVFKLQLENRLQHLQNQSKGTNTRYLTLGILNALSFIIPPVNMQKQFAAFVEQVNKSKATVQQGLDKLETLKFALMQEYFG